MGQIKERLLKAAVKRENEVQAKHISTTKTLIEKGASGPIVLAIYNGKLCIGSYGVVRVRPYNLKGAADFISDFSEQQLTEVSQEEKMWSTDEPLCLGLSRLLTYQRVNKLSVEGRKQTNDIIREVEHILSGEEEKNPGMVK